MIKFLSCFKVVLSCGPDFREAIRAAGSLGSTTIRCVSKVRMVGTFKGARDSCTGFAGATVSCTSSFVS